ncbi:class II aldolase/adducin family protein [Anaerofustis stercorihominis]|uniref:L-ribulose-5-phosphate 4-epimerase n=1 Tax=Anaerofustis stercorihominis DSM 17244 TaxID=445971 RepID=B1C6X9_9FIRM|nr:class II aldolase/adducin family protein [Anaerofustis stercorihominis]EDS72766.1 putative L-ribulose-5-phosphate 4-epimerase [Anaerofustis stercorihominis DSM 17244]MCQ4794135.1 class II aldolase/adducin family protein [Anaerofustis stercorihominis]
MNYKEEVLKFSHILENKGYVNAMEGNISIVDRNKNELYITPSGKRKLFLDEDMISVIDLDSEEQIGGSLKASSEYRLHKAALLARPDCNAVIHCHCTYLTAYALQCESVKIDCCTAFLAVKGEIPCIPFGMPGTTEIANGLEDALKDKNICLLGNHGVICVAKDLEDCSKLIEAMEETTKTFVIANQIGKTKSIPNYDEVLSRFGS